MDPQTLLNKLDSLGLNTTSLKELFLYLQEHQTCYSQFEDLLINLDLYSSEANLNTYTLEVLLAQIKSSLVKVRRLKATRTSVQDVIASRAVKPKAEVQAAPPDMSQILNALQCIKGDLDLMKQQPQGSNPSVIVVREESNPLVNSTIPPVFVDPLIGVKDLEFKTNNIGVVESKTTSINDKLSKLRKLKKG